MNQTTEGRVASKLPFLIPILSKYYVSGSAGMPQVFTNGPSWISETGTFVTIELPALFANPNAQM